MDFLQAIRGESDRFYSIADSSDPSKTVPSCPEWNIGDLVWHLGEVHWFWATDIETRATDPKEVERAKPERPTEYGDVIAFGRGQAARMIQVLEETPDDVAVWTWALEESDHNVAFIRRHQVQEAAVHRWDLEQAATGTPEPIEPDVAVDSIDEVLTINLPWGVRADKPLSGTVHFHCTDADGEWFIHADGKVERTHAKADVAIRDTASNLLLALYKRVPLDALEVVGDGGLAREFAARLDTE